MPLEASGPTCIESILTRVPAAGLGKTWNMRSNQYSWLVTIYYMAYILFQWLILAWRVVKLPVRLAVFNIQNSASNALSGLAGMHGIWLWLYEHSASRVR
jgi:hypothetical protein